MEIKKKGGSKLVDENAELCVKGATVTACSKIARTSIKFRKTRLRPLGLLRAQERISQKAFNCRVSDETT